MSLQAAIQDDGLVRAMHAQIDIRFLEDDHPGLYVAFVKYNRVTFGISGTHAEWSRFFGIVISPAPNPGAVEISLQAAISDANLVRAMLKQIDRRFLQDDHPGLYVAYVKYNRVTYGISGTHAEWIRFFSLY